MCRYFSAQVGCNFFQFSLRPSAASWFCLKCLNVIFDVWKRTTLPVPPGGEGEGGRGGLKPMRAIKNTFPYLDPTCNGLQRPKAAMTLLPKNESFNAPGLQQGADNLNSHILLYKFRGLVFSNLKLEKLWHFCWAKGWMVKLKIQGLTRCSADSLMCKKLDSAKARTWMAVVLKREGLAKPCVTWAKLLTFTYSRY